MTGEPKHRAHYREPRQARSAETPTRVLRAAGQLARPGGLEETTITDVAERAGVSVGSVSRRFEGRSS